MTCLKPLQVKHTVTYKGTPLACVGQLPGDDAELTPTQLRQLAAALIQVADECEILHDTTRRQIPVRREYPLATLPFGGRIDPGTGREPRAPRSTTATPAQSSVPCPECRPGNPGQRQAPSVGQPAGASPESDQEPR